MSSRNIEASENSESQLGETNSAVEVLLRQWNQGNNKALDEILPIVYCDLHKLARHLFPCERAGHTLQPTILIHELYLRFRGFKGVHWKDKAHFYFASVRIIRYILADYARAKNADKRNYREGLNYSQYLSFEGADKIDMYALNQGLDNLARIDATIANIVELRVIFGLSVKEISELLDLTERTVFRHCAAGKSWLRDYLQD